MKTVLFLSLFTVSVAFGAVEVEKVAFGFNGGYKTGTWAPVTITVRGQDEPTASIGDPDLQIDQTHLAVEVRSFSSDMSIQRYTTPLIGSDRKNFYIYCPKNTTQFVIHLAPAPQSGNAAFQSAARRVIQAVQLPTPIARKDYLVLVLAPSGDKLKQLIDKKQLAASDGARVHVEYLRNSTSLPRDWIGYSAADVLVIREMSLTERRISKAQQTAMLDWVERGGTLIVSGGSNYEYLRHSFIEPFLPVELKDRAQIDRIPTALHKQLGFQSFGSNEHLCERIPFSPKPGCETLIGTGEQIYVAKRNFGDGQILCLAFDYNAPPFGVSQKNIEKSEQQVGEAFWRGLLSRYGKSPRHLADRYALALQHEAKINQEFLSKMPTQVPLIKLLSIVLPVYLIGFGGFLFYYGKSRQKSRTYWIGGFFFVLLSVSTIAIARNVLPNNFTADRLSILSVYPERQRAHLLSYVSLRGTARAETTIDFTKGSFIRHQEIEVPQKIGTLVQDSGVQLRGMPVEPWYPLTYVKETFFDTQQLPRILENTWHVTGKEMTYLGNVTLDTKPDPELSAALRLRVTPKMPPIEELNNTREWFAHILRQEQVLRHLAAEANANLRPYLIGWISQGFIDISVDGNININDETLVIFRPNAGR